MRSSKDFYLKKEKINTVLHTAIFEIWPSVSAFCRQSGLDKVRVCELIRFKLSPLKKDGQYRKLCLDLSEYLGLGVSDLFPLSLYGITTELSTSISLECLTKEELELLEDKSISGATFDGLITKTLQEQTAEVMANLTPREEAILCERFGLFKRENIPEEAAKRGVSEESLIQIWDKAMKKLHSFSAKTKE